MDAREQLGGILRDMRKDLTPDANGQCAIETDNGDDLLVARKNKLLSVNAHYRRDKTCGLVGSEESRRQMLNPEFDSRDILAMINTQRRFL